MRRSTDRILTTHTGSLPRPEQLQNLLFALDRHEQIDQTAFDVQSREAVRAIVQQQVSTGIDIVNDGEMSKISYFTYVFDRLTGYQHTSKFSSVQFMRDLLEFPEYAQRFFSVNPISQINFLSCTDAITYTGQKSLQRDLTNLKTALKNAQPTETFMTAASPGILSVAMANQYYTSHEAYLEALATAMKVEYDAIYQAGFLLQVDCPDLPALTDQNAAILIPGSTSQKVRQLHIEALNYATKDIPSDRMRLHLCWGNYEGPHNYDAPLIDFITLVFKARPAGLVFESSNPRHEHEWKIFEEVKLPDGKVLIPGVLDTTTNFIEHPELIAQRIERFAKCVGKENVIAGTDCGFATIAGQHLVDPKIVFAKLQSAVEGAHLASQRLW